MNFFIYIISTTIIAAAYFLESIIGFGGTILSLAFLSLIIDIKSAISLMLILGTLGSLQIFLSGYKYLDKKQFFLMFVGAIGGTMLGSYFLSNLASIYLKYLLAFFIFSYALYNLFFHKKVNKLNSLISVLLTFIGGLFHGILGTGGPPLVIYAHVVMKKKEVFRTTLALTFIFLNIYRILYGLFTNTLFLNELVLTVGIVPFFFIAIALGNIVHFKMNQKSFQKITSLSLLFLAILLVITAR